MMDFNILQTLEHFVFNFILMNAIFILTYLFRNNSKNATITWLLVLVFCLFAYWNTDYFSFRETFYAPDFRDFRDPLYYYLGLLSLNTYTIFRLIIWGGALWLYIMALKRFNVPYNISCFIFSVFFLLSFSVGRIYLGAALYLYGISLLLNPGHNKVYSYIWGAVLVVCSYFGHRAMALFIVLTPLILLKPTKRLVYIIVVAGLALGLVAASLLSQLIAGDIAIGSGSTAEDALLAYASNENDLSMNWKFALTSKLRWYSIYLLVGYCVWKSFFSKYKTIIPTNIQRLVVVCLTAFFFAHSLLQFDTIGANEMGERLLLVLGLPLTLILAYFRKENICSNRTMLLLLFPAFLYAEGFLFGKILSF